MSLSCVGILAHPKRPSTTPVALQIDESLRERGIATWHYTVWDDEDVVDAVQTADMVIAIGGDGAMLRAARVCAPYGVPVLGLNMGRLGFLTEIAGPKVWPEHLDRLLEGDYWIEKRMMITTRVRRDETIIASGSALNDIVISGDGIGRMVQLDTYIDGQWATTYNSDALIISTPTGSTAYALAVGGPILPPDLLNILIVPTAPHLSMDRPIVLSEGSTVAVRGANNNRNTILVTIDGALLVETQPDDVIFIKACDYTSGFVRMRDRNYFYRSLLDRLEPRVNRSVNKPPVSLEDTK